MARIHYDKTSPFGSPFNAAVYQLVMISAQVKRIKKIADDITAVGGAVMLEGCPEFNVAVGHGADFYGALVDINSALNAITSLPSLDPGN
jgi:hypothetical protein